MRKAIVRYGFRDILRAELGRSTSETADLQLYCRRAFQPVTAISSSNEPNTML